MIIIIVLVVVVLIVFYFYRKSTFKLYNGDSWANYRLGDVYLLSKNDRMYDPGYYENILYHKTMYQGTIANEYINKNTLLGTNEKLLREIIEKRVKDRSIYPDTLFLHIRVGDVLCVKDNEWINKVNGPLYYSKVGDRVWWNNIIDYIRKNNISKVVIVSGSHKNKCLKESTDYLEDRKRFL